MTAELSRSLFCSALLRSTSSRHLSLLSLSNLPSRHRTCIYTDIVLLVFMRLQRELAHMPHLSGMQEPPSLSATPGIAPLLINTQSSQGHPELSNICYYHLDNHLVEPLSMPSVAEQKVKLYKLPSIVIASRILSQCCMPMLFRTPFAPRRISKLLSLHCAGRLVPCLLLSFFLFLFGPSLYPLPRILLVTSISVMRLLSNFRPVEIEDKRNGTTSQANES